MAWKTILKNLAKDLRTAEDPALRGFGQDLGRSLKEGDSREMIANQVEAIAHDIAGLRDHVKSILRDA